MSDLAVVLAKQNKYAEAEALNREAFERRSRTLGEDDPDTLQSLQNLAAVLVLREKFAEAESYLLVVQPKREKVHGRLDRRAISGLVQIARAYIGQDKLADAEPVLLDAVDRYKSSANPYSDDSRNAISLLVKLAETTSRPAIAAHWQAQLDAFPQKENK